MINLTYNYTNAYYNENQFLTKQVDTDHNVW